MDKKSGRKQLGGMHLRKYILFCDSIYDRLKASLSNKKILEIANGIVASHGEHYIWQLVMINRTQIEDIIQTDVLISINEAEFDYDSVMLSILTMYYINGAKFLLKNLETNFKIEIESDEVSIVISAAKTFISTRNRGTPSLFTLC
ncbi:MAG: hypothetical protein PHE67_00985 [Campylobacterales bacterium]|nr:hypothetical protein [Campylobacterales bacterium]